MDLPRMEFRLSRKEFSRCVEIAIEHHACLKDKEGYRFSSRNGRITFWVGKQGWELAEEV